ncbi:hypothetical protein KNP414_04145 [Paenibacillus mucilaginosus KNP414]|uniref:Uncharacterized protein n=1 Tax=Paenibacillus mucilaginosus (strain KNP414) TaxID=1036673 RepID=F8FFQ0_PAEMK|nr:hypothetical protein KNP414_04145 [Paenibacillus mucilaginosus KNP414]
MYGNFMVTHRVVPPIVHFSSWQHTGLSALYYPNMHNS